MVISDAEKKILLERLQKAREVKAAKAAAAKKTPVPKKEAPPQPPPAPTIEPIPSPPVVESTARYVRVDESSVNVLKDDVQHLPPLDCVVDDEIALPPKIKKHETREKREKFDNSSDESDDEKPVKKSSKTSKKVKQTPYMKIKIFHEPKNAHALQNLIEAVQNNDDEEESVQELLPSRHNAHAPELATQTLPRLRHDIKNQTPKSSRTLPSHQELMRKAALEFFA
jgi:hypothetical protein